MSITKALKTVSIVPIVLLGTLYHKLIGSTPPIIYSGFRRVFYLTNGIYNNKISALISRLYPFKKRGSIESKLLGHLNDKQVENIVKKLENDGFYVFPNLIPQTYINELTSFAESMPCNLVPAQNHKTIFDSNNIKATKYGIDEQSIIEQHVTQEIILDSGLIEIAGRYLNSEPINDLVSMWWSTNFSSKASNEAAQMYHFDLDRIKFLKFFIYLTDVDTNTGPHMFVRGSHKLLPLGLQKDGRFTDEEISKEYSQKDIIEIIGKKGSLVAVDTRGLHKGKPLILNYRLIFQVEYANSTFGMNYGKLKVNKTECLSSFNKYKINNPRFFKRYIFN